MTVVINGTTGITNPNNMTVGNGGGSVATNTAVGTSALAGSNTGSGQNTGIGNLALNANTSGAYNSAVGSGALYSNTTGSNNVAVGQNALVLNTTANNNTAVGYQAGYSNTTGQENTAIGQVSLTANTTGSYNTAVGRTALYSNTTASYNTSVGQGSLQNNTTASGNVAVGYQAGYTQTTAGGGYNTYIGYSAGRLSTSYQNVFVGSNTGENTTGANNTFIGVSSGQLITSGNNNSILGRYNGNQGGLDIRTSSNYIVLSDGDGNPRGYFDNNGTFFVSSTIGVIYSIGVYNTTTASAANINVSSTGAFSRSTSALKYKQDIRDVEDFDISALRPVRYKSKCEGDDQTKDHLGLIADEAAEAGFEELVTRGADGEIEGFQYERLTVVLLKSLQSLKAEFDAYKATHP